MNPTLAVLKATNRLSPCSKVGAHGRGSGRQTKRMEHTPALSVKAVNKGLAVYGPALANPLVLAKLKDITRGQERRDALLDIWAAPPLFGQALHQFVEDVNEQAERERQAQQQQFGGTPVKREPDDAAAAPEPKRQCARASAPSAIETALRQLVSDTPFFAPDWQADLARDQQAAAAFLGGAVCDVADAPPPLERVLVKAEPLVVPAPARVPAANKDVSLVDAGVARLPCGCGCGYVVDRPHNRESFRDACPMRTNSHRVINRPLVESQFTRVCCAGELCVVRRAARAPGPEDLGRLRPPAEPAARAAAVLRTEQRALDAPARACSECAGRRRGTLARVKKNLV